MTLKGGVTRTTASGFRNPDMKADCWSAERASVMKEVDEEESPIATESTKVEEAATGRGLEH